MIEKDRSPTNLETVDVLPLTRQLPKTNRLVQLARSDVSRIPATRYNGASSSGIAKALQPEQVDRPSETKSAGTWVSADRFKLANLVRLVDYLRIVGELRKLGVTVSATSVRNIPTAAGFAGVTP